METIGMLVLSVVAIHEAHPSPRNSLGVESSKLAMSTRGST